MISVLDISKKGQKRSKGSKSQKRTYSVLDISKKSQKSGKHIKGYIVNDYRLGILY
jgi:hypothetical protein